MSMDRFRGCLIGLAVGEALGDQLARLGDPFHTPLVVEPPLRHGDGTDQALAVARGLLSAFMTGHAQRILEEGIASEMILWHGASRPDDRVPEPTTFAAIGRALDGGSWGNAGDPNAHPGSVALRAVPLGLAFSPSDVLAPTLIATRLTHQSAAALEGAAFTAWLVSQLVRGARLDRSLVISGLDVVASLGSGGALADAVTRAMEVHARLVDRPAQWLPVDEIAPDDRGRTVEGAIALALVASLTATAPDIEAAIELAARHHGDSAVVAALTGALLGAAWGTAGLPLPLVEPLESLEVLVALAEALHDESDLAGEPPEPPGPVAHEHRVFVPQEEDAVSLDVSEAEASLVRPAPPPPTETRWVTEGEIDRKALFAAWRNKN